MANLKLKSLRLTKTKVAEIEGERRVTFVASTETEDRDYEKVIISTFRLPKKGGGEIIVSEISAEGTDEVDIPLLTDHDLFEVEKVIGSVRKAYFTNGELIFEAGISSRDYAQDVFKLIDEGHLDNAFSISFRDFNFNPDNGEIRNGEIIEVSLVTRGSNKDARVLEVKGVKGDDVETETTKPTEEAKEEVVETTEAQAETVEEKAEAEVVDETNEADAEPVEETEEESPTEETNETSEKEEERKETEMDAKSIAKAQVVEPATQEAKSTSADYLKSKSAVKDFVNLTVEMKGQSPDAIKKAWEANLEAKGISGDAILPAQIEQIFFKAWYDQTGILSTFRNIRTNASAMYAFSGEGEGIRAKGHKKGDTKAGQAVATVRRDLKQKLIYKLLAIDLQDLLDDQTGELNAFRVEELAGRVADEIARGAVTGDGRTAPESGADYRVFDGTRGLFSMKADLDNAGTDAYAGLVATTVENVATDNLYDKIVKALGEVREINGQGKVVVVPTGSISALKLIKNENGSYIFNPGSSVEDGIEAQIFEMDSIEGSGYDVIAFANQGYGLYSTNDMVRTSFDVNTNTDAMLVERSVAGSAYGYRAVAGYKSAA